MKPAGYWNPQRVDEAFDLVVKEIGGIPTAAVIRKRLGGVLDTICTGRYGHGITKYSEYIQHRGLAAPEWTPKRVNEAFDALRSELGQVPTQSEFLARYRAVAIAPIRAQEFGEDVKTYNDYVRYRGHQPRRVRNLWTPQKIDNAFDELRAEKGRVPSHGEFAERFGSALGAIVDGRYRLDIKNYSAYVRHRGLEPLSDKKREWKRENIEAAFRKITADMGRQPSVGEFRERFPGAMKAIFRGSYDPQIKKWSGFVKAMGGTSSFTDWTPEFIEREFERISEELGRTPTSTEFEEKTNGGFQAIRRGEYRPNITTFNQFLEAKGITPKRTQWTPENIDAAFDSLRNSLGRVPSSNEFQKKNPSAMNAIRKGQYDTDISDYRQYVQSRGLCLPTYRRRSLDGHGELDALSSALDEFGRQEI